MSSDGHKAIQALLGFPEYMSNMIEILIVSDSRECGRQHPYHPSLGGGGGFKCLVCLACSPDPVFRQESSLSHTPDARELFQHFRF